MDTDPLAPPRGASVWELELYEHLTTHARREGQMLQEYIAEGERTGSKALAYVIEMLANDERRHHGHMADLAASLKSEAEVRKEPPVVPRLDFDAADTEQILALTRRLIENEKDDAAALKKLRKDLDDVADSTLWALLVDMMRIDTEKHLTMLRFVEQHAKRRRR